MRPHSVFHYAVLYSERKWYSQIIKMTVVKMNESSHGPCQQVNFVVRPLRAVFFFILRLLEVQREAPSRQLQAFAARNRPPRWTTDPVVLKKRGIICRRWEQRSRRTWINENDARAARVPNTHRVQLVSTNVPVWERTNESQGECHLLEIELISPRDRGIISLQGVHPTFWTIPLDSTTPASMLSI